MADVVWDQHALEVYLVDVEHSLLADIASDVEDVARAIAPVRVRRTEIPVWARKGYIGTPGRLKASVTSYVSQDFLGPYADVGSLWYGRFMDPPAKQLHHLIPFLPSALYAVVEGRTYFL